MNRQHLISLHKRLAKSHREQGALYKSAVSIFGDLRECMKADLSDEQTAALQDYSELHGALAAHHEDEAAFHDSQAATLADATKSADADGLSKVHVFPLDLESVMPRENLTMIPRTGQPPARTDLERAAVPEEFKALLNFD